MSDLLIHSMRELAPIVLPVLEAAGARRIVEIGAEHGGMSAVLAEYASAAGGSLVSIDPAPSPAFLEWTRGAAGVEHVARPSLEAIDGLSQVDAWLIDGDHNWYTVYHELAAIRRVTRRDRRPLLVFLHDVGWPCARRDFYYAPERIPAEYRHAYRFDAGVTLDSGELLPNRGFRGRGHFAWACHEGGPRNGVLTAIEDFVAERYEAGERLAWACVPAVFGMGALFDLDAPWAARAADVFAPWHNHPLLATLEENRLRNYLTVIEHQDAEQLIA